MGIHIRHLPSSPGNQCRRIGHKPMLIISPAIDHVLPHCHAKPVTMIIPSLGFDLNMLSEHIKSQLFHLLNIENQRFIRRCRIQTIRPVSLIQNPILKLYLSIQTDTRHLLCIHFYRKAAQSKITLYSIILHSHRKIIQPWFVTGPRPDYWNWNFNLLVRQAGNVCDDRPFSALCFP